LLNNSAKSSSYVSVDPVYNVLAEHVERIRHGSGAAWNHSCMTLSPLYEMSGFIVIKPLFN